MSLGAAVLALLAACGSSAGEPELRSRPGSQTSAAQRRSADWTLVDTGGTVRAMHIGDGAIIAVGTRPDGRPLLATVKDDLAIPVPLRFPASRTADGLATIASEGEGIALSTAPRGGQATEIWSSYWDIDFDDGYDVERLPLPRDRQGRRPTWARPLTDGEEDLRIVGVTPDSMVQTWEQPIGSEPTITGNLYLHGDAATSLRVGNTEVRVVVAGPLSTSRDVAPDGPSLWSAASDFDGPHRWERVPLAPAPQAITDIAYWEVGFWVAGVSGGKPVIYGFDDGSPDVPAPHTTLDARHPSVLFASAAPYLHGPPVLATQSVDGPTVWQPVSGGYARYPAPAGQLQAAASQGGFVYVVVDGRLWTRRLPGTGAQQ